MRPLMVFIDDSPFERAVFAECIVPAADEADFVIGATYAEALEGIGSRYPGLFLLDLYGRDETVAGRIPEPEELRRMLPEGDPVRAIFDGLAETPPDLRLNEFLKRLYHQVDPWRRLFFNASRGAGQNIRYGLGNLQLARRDFPSAAMMAYTRKSVIRDAVEVLRAGADGVDLKPDADTDGEIRRVTAQKAPELLAVWRRLATERLRGGLRDLALRLHEAGLGPDAHRLGRPEELSAGARDLAGLDGLRFLAAARDWGASA